MSGFSRFAVVIAIASATAARLVLDVPATEAQEQPVAAESDPPGDIPDSQAFVTYYSPLGFSLKIPEGWAMTERPDGALFADKYDGVEVSVSPAGAAPTPTEVKKNEAAALVNAGRAVQISAVKGIALPAGPAVLIVYTSNSEPNPVTDKQIRLENNRYLLFRNGQEVALSFWAPAGADNVDQWQLMSKSFQWK